VVGAGDRGFNMVFMLLINKFWYFELIQGTIKVNMGRT
jgi:hypothetical protein